MIAVTTYRDKRVALFGLGGSGMATALALIAGGAELTAFDDNPEQVKAAATEGIATQNLRELDFSKIDALILAPGVPLTHPKPHWSVELAKSNKVPIIGDVELFANERRVVAPDSKFIAITGTNGKSTTTVLISHVLESAGRNVQMGGNIGRAVLSLDPLSDDAIYVVECSSYQIDLAPTLDPTIGILLNLAPDHLERHGDMDHYASIKERLVAASGEAIIGVDDDYSAAIAAYHGDGKRHIHRISNGSSVDEGVYLSGHHLERAMGGMSHQIADLEGIPALRGVHNGQNAAACWLACHLVGLSDEEIQAGFRSFPGLAHRMEPVGSIGRIVFVNDSKATNADAAAMALASYDHIYWIAGGLAKEGGINSLRSFFPKIEKAYLVGEAAPEFAAVLSDDVAFEISGTIGAAVQRAFDDASAAAGDAELAILLSPACASFDQFANFEIRGEAFRTAVEAINGVEYFKEAS
ncbi:MAG: UDP-N-acetylmuramoyl-L-alanine--D-glutamate ligase [Hyphomicrobiales bacterium]|nr:MAG: UDP-N-acetylmuramoyl-L-alanine--D-glutamate ligase [Hyphomicrobiales bacterium]